VHVRLKQNQQSALDQQLIVILPLKLVLNALRPAIAILNNPKFYAKTTNVFNVL